MKTTGNRLPRVATTAAAVILGVFASASAQSATCKDELDRFEFRLNSSSLAETEPDTFEALVRQAEEAAGMRDEEQCLQTVAALHDAIPADPGAQTNKAAPATSASRPSAPVLIMAGGGDEPDETEQEQEQDGASSASDDDDRYFDD